MGARMVAFLESLSGLDCLDCLAEKGKPESKRHKLETPSAAPQRGAPLAARTYTLLGSLSYCSHAARGHSSPPYAEQLPAERKMALSHEAQLQLYSKYVNTVQRTLDTTTGITLGSYVRVLSVESATKIDDDGDQEAIVIFKTQAVHAPVAADLSSAVHRARRGTPAELFKHICKRLETELTVKFVQLSSSEGCAVLHKHRSAIARRIGQLETEFATLAGLVEEPSSNISAAQAAHSRRYRLERFGCAGTSLAPILTSIWAKVVAGRDYAAVQVRLRVPGLPEGFLVEAWPVLESALSSRLIALYGKACHDIELAVNAAAPRPNPEEGASAFLKISDMFRQHDPQNMTGVSTGMMAMAVEQQQQALDDPAREALHGIVTRLAEDIRQTVGDLPRAYNNEVLVRERAQLGVVEQGLVAAQSKLTGLDAAMKLRAEIKQNEGFLRQQGGGSNKVTSAAQNKKMARLNDEIAKGQKRLEANDVYKTHLKGAAEAAVKPGGGGEEAFSQVASNVKSTLASQVRIAEQARISSRAALEAKESAYEACTPTATLSPTPPHDTPPFATRADALMLTKHTFTRASPLSYPLPPVAHTLPPTSALPPSLPPLPSHSSHPLTPPHLHSSRRRVRYGPPRRLLGVGAPRVAVRGGDACVAASRPAGRPDPNPAGLAAKQRASGHCRRPLLRPAGAAAAGAVRGGFGGGAEGAARLGRAQRHDAACRPARLPARSRAADAAHT